MLCVSIGAKDAETLAGKMAKAEGRADLVEVRLDMLAPGGRDAALKAISSCTLPVIATNRPKWEGGEFDGSEEERISLLKQAVEAGADFVDIELATIEARKTPILECCSSCGCRLIVSHHDFEATPGTSELKDLLKRMALVGPNIAKIVTTAHTELDARAILGAYCHASVLPFEMIAFAMGSTGTMSRIACLALGAPFTYVSLSENEATAAGQIGVDVAREIIESLGKEGRL